MDNKRKSRFDSNIEVCSDWAAVTNAFEQLPKPGLRRDEAGQANREGWIYRGHKSQIHRLGRPFLGPMYDWPTIRDPSCAARLLRQKTP
jgi:hypothetical protein